MSNKRRNTSSPECEQLNKRLREQPVEEDLTYDDVDSDYEPSHERPQVDVSTGQSGAFPGLSSAGDDVFYGPANDGIDYLRMVRSEAKGIPQLLRAQVDGANDSLEKETEDHDGGYWDDDGTFTAVPYVAPKESGSTMPRAQIEYYRSLLAQFAVIRATVKCVPPLSAIEKLTSSQPISFPAESKNARRSWIHCLRTRHPHPVQIACMEEDSVLELLNFMTVKMRGLFEKQHSEAIQRIGSWVWAVLGKCPDRGLLGSDEMSALRQFAQKAIEVRDWLQRRDTTRNTVLGNGFDQEDSENESGVEEEEHISSAIASARARLDSSDIVLAEDSVKPTIETDDSGAHDPEEQARSPLQESMVFADMVVTVVGELYGQRDLLELRQTWDEDVAQPT